MESFKELREKAELLNQNPSLNQVNSLLFKICRELERFDPVVKTTNVEPIEEDARDTTEEPVKKKKSRKKK